MPWMKLSVYKSSFVGGINEGKSIILDFPKRFQSKSISEKLLSILKISLLPMAIYFSMTMEVIPQIFGIIGLMMAMILPRYHNNKHINAIVSIMAFIMCGQSILLQNWGYAGMTAIAGSRTFMLACIGDRESDKPLRTKIAMASIIAGIFVVGGIGIFKDIYAFLPLCAMTCGAFASAMINSETSKSHLLYAIGSSFNAVYNMIMMNIFAVFIEGLSVTNHLYTIYETRQKQRKIKK